MKALYILDQIPDYPFHLLEMYDTSKIVEFATCPRKYFYHYVLGWQQPSNHLVFGHSWHEAMEYLLTHDYSTESVQQAHQLLLADYRKTYDPASDALYEPKTPLNALFVLAAYANTYRSDLNEYNVLHTEIGGRVPIGVDQNNEDIFLTYRMDSILEDKQTGKIISLEHKTASSFYNWSNQWELAFQPGTYTHVLNCAFEPARVKGIIMNGAAFRKVKKAWEDLAQGRQPKNQLPYEFLRFHAARSTNQMDSWLWHVNYYIDQIRWQFKLLHDCSDDDHILGAFPQNPESCTKYTGCEYHNFCTAYQNPLRKALTTPIGYRREFWDPMARPVKFKLDPKMLNERRKNGRTGT